MALKAAGLFEYVRPFSVGLQLYYKRDSDTDAFL